MSAGSLRDGQAGAFGEGLVDRPATGLLNATFKAAILGVGVAVLFLAMFFMVTWFSLDRGIGIATMRVQRAYDNGQLSTSSAVAHETIRGTHQFNDCLILGMALNQPADAQRSLVISPIALMHVPPDAPAGSPGAMESPCLTLQRLVTDGTTEAPGQFYHRYLHGQVILARFLLPALEIHQIRLLYRSTLALALVTGLATSLVLLVRTRNFVFVGFLIGFVGLSRWFGIGSFGQSLGHAPSDLLPVIYLLALCVGAARGMGRPALIVLAAIFGAVTAGFELLSGGLPLGLAMVLGGSVMAGRKDIPSRDVLLDGLAALAAFIAAALTCIVAKQLAVIAYFGIETVAGFVQQLRLRMLPGQYMEAAPNGGPGLFLAKLAGGLSSLAENSHVLAGGTLFVAILAGGWGLRQVVRVEIDPAARTRLVLLAASNLIIFGWFPLLWQHTIQHAWFMDRILVWPIITGAWLFAAGCRLPNSSKA
jgi:hypothetical protein